MSIIQHDFKLGYQSSSCNNLNDGSVYPIMFNSIPSTYIWSDGSVGDTLKNVSAGIPLFITDTNNCVEYHQFQLNDPYFIFWKYKP